MIRLPPTGIDISPNDLNFHLQQLDIYHGLLKQGFKKKEIIKYFEDQNSETADNKTPDAIPSTVELCASFADSPQSDLRRDNLDASSRESPHIRHSPSQTSEHPLWSKRHDSRDSGTRSITITGKVYTPRKSSLLQYSKGVSSDTSSDDNKTCTRTPFSPRSNMRYRARSQTYSHEQSEPDESYLKHLVDTSLQDLHHLSLDDDLVPPNQDTRSITAHIVSDLRPEADSFTPTSIHELKIRELKVLKGKEKAESSDESDNASIPSSPPLLPSLAIQGQRSPSLPRTLQTPPAPRTAEPVTARRHIHQQFLDGSFAIYDDSVPAQLQPQTPADISRGPMLNTMNAAFTAPPGMLRSPIPFHSQYVHGTRQSSGDQSPTTRALLIRQRRQREFNRGAHVEELRINRVRADQSSEDMQTLMDFWRDDLDADGVGEENFDEAMVGGDVRRLRTISGNRRP